MKDEENKTNEHSELEEVGIVVTKDKINLARQKNTSLAKNKAIFTFFSTVITIFTIVYSDINQLLMLTVIFFVVPTYFDTINMNNDNAIVKKLIFLYKCIFWILNAIIILVFIWFIFGKDDALYWTSYFFKYVLFIDVFINVIFSITTFLNLSSNLKEHLALVVVSETSKEKIKERLEFQEKKKRDAIEENRNFIKKKSQRGGKR